MGLLEDNVHTGNACRVFGSQTLYPRHPSSLYSRKHFRDCDSSFLHLSLGIEDPQLSIVWFLCGP